MVGRSHKIFRKLIGKHNILEEASATSPASKYNKLIVTKLRCLCKATLGYSFFLVQMSYFIDCIPKVHTCK